MSVFFTPIAVLSQKIFDTPSEFNAYFAITNDLQECCFDKNLFLRFSVGIVGKELMLIHDIAIHLLASSIKLSLGGIKGLSAIPAGAFGLETDHQKCIKEGVVHLGFCTFYVVDYLISLSNINNTYPKDLFEKIKNIFAKFLEIPNKKVLIIDNPETEKALKEKQIEAAASALALSLNEKKLKEQQELLERKQQELEDERNSDFISEEELDNICKQAHEDSIKKPNQEFCQTKQLIPTSEEPYILPIIINKKIPSYYNLYGDWSEDEDTSSTPFSTKPNLEAMEPIKQDTEQHNKTVLNPLKESEAAAINPSVDTTKQIKTKRKKYMYPSSTANPSTLSPQEKHDRRTQAGNTFSNRNRTKK